MVGVLLEFQCLLVHALYHEMIDVFVRLVEADVAVVLELRESAFEFASWLACCGHRCRRVRRRHLRVRAV